MAHPDQPFGFRPLCGCGCGGRVALRSRKFLKGHVPAHVYAGNVRESRKRFAFRRRRILFAKQLQALTRGGRTLTTEAILDAFAEVYRIGYERGFWTGGKRHLLRKAA